MNSMAVSAESSSAATVELQHNGAHIESLVLLEKPLGNQYTASIVAKNHVGYFGLWPDEVLSIFLEYLDSHLLLRLSTACKFLYAFCRSDDLWKTLFIE